mmetsp:Transcript_13092/g.22261  ORF Transcript_13092/g.22261 Transcript_13092/m.22261 type:complete len:135 (-) Transcript_13092:63-467(-)
MLPMTCDSKIFNITSQPACAFSATMSVENADNAENLKKKDGNNEDAHPYKCQIDIALPSESCAMNVKSVLEVDQEIGDRVKKSFTLTPDSDHPSSNRVLRVSFQATEAKMLRVAVSTFYDYLTVALKCLQEFGQ